MRRKVVVLLMVVTTVLGGTLLHLDTVFASTKSELNDQKKELNKKKSEINSEKAVVEDEYDQLEGEISQLDKEIKALDLAQAETNSQIREQQSSIESVKQEITTLQEEIVVVQERIAERNDLLKERVRSLQATGGVVQYLEVILGSQDFSDFIDRMTAVTTIFKADKEILTKHQEDKLLLEQKQSELQTALEALESKLAELETMLAKQKAQEQSKQQLMSKLETQQEELQHEIHELENEAEIIAAQSAAIAKELERIKKAEAEEAARKKKEQEEAAKSGKSGQSDQSSSAPAASGDFIRPSEGPVTSNYGSRWGRLHAGIDIGKRGSSVPVVSVASGTVISSYYSSSYGNVVFIAHSVNGQMWTTVYAHLENREVSAGQTVQQGQRVGYMGNTGRSTGPHLHFELHKGGWNGSKSNSVNPRNYINF
ncbi:murein hydrolase activator EnvC family protein [Bacillus pinisoli]|uniref:murein hydrolase activator EnvC family protein n=1 Tax=Bacillus pinisoli TaxID=2901866 RepID=UPI001FF221E8|nr:peptidoglycan DD-metalloendopeptidase family protein [Bacillus pinisoli]